PYCRASRGPDRGVLTDRDRELIRGRSRRHRQMRPTTMRLRHLARELSTALELALVRMAPNPLIEELASASGLVTALQELPLDSAPLIEVRQAYDVLRDPASRRQWDETHASYSERRHSARFSSHAVDLTSGSSAQSLLDTFFDAFDLLAAGFMHEGRAAPAERL